MDCPRQNWIRSWRRWPSDQGNDIGTQYRSALYTFSDAQHQAAVASKAAYQKALGVKGLGAITTEIPPAGQLYFAEDYHQQ